MTVHSRITVPKELMQCCICTKDVGRSGKNPAPLIGEKCCDACHTRFVLPTIHWNVGGDVRLPCGTVNKKVEILTRGAQWVCMEEVRNQE